MGLLAWVVMGLAVWHFTIWLPDHFWGGIVGALIGSIAGAVVIGLAIHGFDVPGTRDTHLITAIEGIPGSLIGMAIVYAIGLRRRAQAGPDVPAPPRGGGSGSRSGAAARRNPSGPARRGRPAAG